MNKVKKRHENQMSMQLGKTKGIKYTQGKGSYFAIRTSNGSVLCHPLPEHKRPFHSIPCQEESGLLSSQPDLDIEYNNDKLRYIMGNELLGSRKNN